MPVLRDLLADLDVRILCGDPGVPVRWVHISELADPTPWLSGGELLLTTGQGLDTDAEQRAYVERLQSRGVAGLGFGVGLRHDAVPSALLEEATKREFPLIEIPYELPFIAITEKAAAEIVSQQYVLLRRALAAHERLERVVIAEGGLDGITSALSELIGGRAAVLDARGRVLAGTKPPNGDALVVPVPGEGTATLAAGKNGGKLSALDRLIVSQAVTVVAVELLRRRIAADTERSLAGDVLAAVLAGDLEGDDLQRRLQPFGLTGGVGVLVVEAPRATRAQIEDRLSRATKEEAGAGLVASAGPLSVVLLPGAPDEELFALAKRVRDRVDPLLPGGIGRSQDQLRRAFHEARCAHEARVLAGLNGGGLATYRDLGSFQLLLSLQDDESLKLFCDSVLAPIERGEGAYGDELIRSLEAFIECNGSWERAAKRLFCHRHTLRYRIRRVEELTGRSLDSARDRIDFWLALRGRELIST